MATPEQALTQDAPVDVIPETSEQASQHFKTVAVRVTEGLHAQLSFIAQLTGSNISEEIRTAIEARIASAQEDPELLTKAQQVSERIEREAAARTAAIAGFIGSKATAPSAAGKPSRARRSNKTGGE